MRRRTAILILIAVMKTHGTYGQGMQQGGRSDRTIDRHWPDDGAKNPSAASVNWDGDDAVGLQFREHSPSASYLVPVKLLKLPPEARKEMQKSDKALRAGDIKGSAEHLEKLLDIMPDSAIAHNSLGTRYVVLRDYDKAVEEFEKAAALKPGYRLAMDNVAVTYCMQHRYAEAEPAAREALEIQPNAATSRYLLGSILVNEDKPTEEALQLLTGVREEYPRARLFLAKAFLAKGEARKALEELRAYVKSPQATDNGVAEAWLARLERELGEEPGKSTGRP